MRLTQTRCHVDGTTFDLTLLLSCASSLRCLRRGGMRALAAFQQGASDGFSSRLAHLPNGVLCFCFVVRLLVSCLLLLLPPFASCRLSASSACLLLLWAMPGFSLGTKSSVTTGGSRTFCPSTAKASSGGASRLPTSSRPFDGSGA